MQAQAAAFQIASDAVAPFVQLFGAVLEQGEVVHVAQVALRAQRFLAEVAVQIHVGEELAGDVADGRPTPFYGRELIQWT